MRRWFFALVLCVLPLAAYGQFNGCPAGFCSKVATGGSGGLGLQTNLVAFWEFQTTSWLDSTANANNLTGNNSPTTVTGVVGNAIGLVAASSQSASITNNASLQVGAGSFSVQTWVKSTGACGELCFAAKAGGGFGNQEWGLGTVFTSGNFFACSFFENGTTEHDLASSVAFDSTVPHHIVMTWNSATKVLTCYVDTVATTATYTLNGVNSTSQVTIGGGTVLGVAFTNGFVDQTGIWAGRVLSVSDVSLLYNSGAGLSYAAMNFLLKRDVMPEAANDNTPMFLNKVA